MRVHFKSIDAPALFAAAAVVMSLSFAAFTGHMWEDYLITFRASLNFAMGNGLVYQPGERVHSFTSPLGTLLPALFAIGGVENVAVRALWGLRIVSALALGGALWIAVRTFQRDGKLLRTFDTRQTIDAFTFLPGRGYLDFDAEFRVYRRNILTEAER